MVYICASRVGICPARLPRLLSVVVPHRPNRRVRFLPGIPSAPEQIITCQNVLLEALGSARRVVLRILKRGPVPS